MSRDLSKFTDWFRSGQWPDAHCPHCKVGLLAAETVTEIESYASSSSRGHEAWEPEWIGGYFMCLLRCQRAICREVTVAVGDWRVRDVTNSYSRAFEYDNFFRLRSTVPPIPVVPSLDVFPDPVREALDRASEVIWVDPSAASGRLRIAIERALDALKVPKLSSGAKRVRLTTHERIGRLRLKHPEAADLMEAVKWVGNQGAHEDSLTTADVLEVAGILSEALVLLFDKSSVALSRRARGIIKAKRMPRVARASLTKRPDA